MTNNMTLHRRAVDSPHFTCKYCRKQFVREHHYLAHKCKEMKRDEELRTPNGQAALNYYQLWMRTMKRTPPSAAAFATSRYYRTFVNFVEFSKAVDLPKPDKFIWLMVYKDFPPTIWTNDEVYTTYLEFLDRKTSPLDQASLSIETLLAVADKHEIEPSEVFTVLKAQDIIHMLRTRRLSAWLLLFSKKFKHLFAHETTTDQRLIIENLIRPEYWGDKLEEYADEVKTIKMLVSEMGI